MSAETWRVIESENARRWYTLGIGGAHEDIALRGEPCLTIEEARRRNAAWLRDTAATAEDIEACAQGYLAGWASALRDASAHSIGGNAAEHTPRGFAVYGRVTDGRGNVVRVQRSSVVGDPHCYVFVNDSDGREFRVGVPGCDHGVAVVSPHLNAPEARALAALLVAFADDADEVAK